jgi:hypothetical protein
MRIQNSPIRLWAFSASFVPLSACFQELAGWLALAAVLFCFILFGLHVLSGAGFGNRAVFRWSALAAAALWVAVVVAALSACAWLSECESSFAAPSRWGIGLLSVCVLSMVCLARSRDRNLVG